MPAGRPTKIDQVITRRDGSKVPITEVIVQAVRAGNYVETAAALAGVSKDTVYHWLREGARASTKTTRLTPFERHAVTFSDAVAQAEAESESGDVGVLTSLAQGVTRVERIVVDQEGNEISRTVLAERVPPNDRVLMWRLERRFGARWGRQRVELSGPDGGPVEVEATITDQQGVQLAEVLRGVVFELVEEVRRDLEAGVLDLDRLQEIEAQVPALLRQQIERVVGE
jgi:transposase